MERARRDENVNASGFRVLERIDPALDVAIVGAAQPGHRRVLDRARNRLHRLEIAVRRGREARFDHVDAHPLQQPRDAQLLFLGHRGAGALLAVAHGRVEYDQFVFHGAAPVKSRKHLRRLLAPRPGTAELGLGLCAREAQQQTRQEQAAEGEAESDGAEMHAGNITGFPGYCNGAGPPRRRFFHTQYTYPDSPYATNSRNSTIGGSEITRINPRTISRITANGTDRRKLMPLKLWKGTLLTIVIPA